MKLIDPFVLKKTAEYLAISILMVIFSCTRQQNNTVAPSAIAIEEELQSKTIEELRMLRNEIFARKGYVFKDSALQEYFRNQQWYVPLDKNDELKLTETEKQRIELIKKLEKRILETSKNKNLK